ncbi:aldose 1-epimerase family protein [Lactobacillus sp. 0.1XD8-4]|uniref:aldose 1-epimerase family protein n=1 Tax=uncultured Limosilactobacillus sp. TaxID=2837629 RepID=UPI00129EEA5E|nr:aldose 1-epimerase family protein [uncultured Limosilactobacillus sp.]MRN06911.1 aldose 1-epimerase family protein [Lactobacillus sp. 0.1XD8-4]
MITLQNQQLTIQINELGAQLHSIKRLDNQIEYLWQGDPASWKRQAPILFPFVGRLKNDQYSYAGKTYHQTQHGFARDRQFNVIEQTPTMVIMEQHDDDKTLQVFPFSFNLQVKYELQNNKLAVSYRVINPSEDKTLIYAIGAHPGFNMPLTKAGVFNRTKLSVWPAEEYSRVLLEGPYNDLEHPQLIDMKEARMLDHDDFNHDAIIFKTDGGHFTAKLTDTVVNHGVTVDTFDTEYVGVWSQYPATAPFVCVEPWWGIADNVNADGTLLHKQGMHRLAPAEEDNYKFSIEPF